MALTASTDKESVARALEAGADDYLTKPFNPLDLLVRVRNLCKISDFIKKWNVLYKNHIETFPYCMFLVF
jgi:DNA-binding response OmpR family regulator